MKRAYLATRKEIKTDDRFKKGGFSSALCADDNDTRKLDVLLDSNVLELVNNGDKLAKVIGKKIRRGGFCRVLRRHRREENDYRMGRLSGRFIGKESE